jgi:hypothetical protein
VLRGHGLAITTPVATTNCDHGKNGSSVQQSAEINNTDLVTAKIEFEIAKTRMVGT